MAEVVVHGIPNCDTVKKARSWLTEHGVAYRFHDFRKDGLDAATVRGWVDAVGWDVLVNRAGTTWRKLPDADRSDLDADKAVALMVANPSLVKRPVVTGAGDLLVGFKPDLWAARF